MKLELQHYPGIMLGSMIQTGEAEFPDKTVKAFTEISFYIPFFRLVIYSFRDVE